MYKYFVSLPKIWVLYINNLDYLLIILRAK